MIQGPEPTHRLQHLHQMFRPQGLALVVGWRRPPGFSFHVSRFVTEEAAYLGERLLVLSTLVSLHLISVGHDFHSRTLCQPLADNVACRGSDLSCLSPERTTTAGIQFVTAWVC